MADGTSRAYQTYYGLIIPRVLALLAPAPTGRAASAHRRAAASALARMLAGEDTPAAHRELAASVLLPILHDPFLRVTPPPSLESDENTPAAPSTQGSLLVPLTPAAALETLTTILTNTDPAPLLISSLLTRIVPPLHSLLEHLHRTKASDPALKETVRGLLSTWARAVAAGEGGDALWAVIEGSGCDWEVDVAGGLRVVERRISSPHLSDEMSDAFPQGRTTCLP